jgi:5-methylthioadenosine/S-adenosylhomocysteine deaminase
VAVRLIRNCSVLEVPATGEVTVAEHQDIEIVDGAIAAIHPTREVSDGVGDIVDGTGLLAMPGLTNSHTHSPMVMFRGAAEDVSVEDWFNVKIWPMEVNLTPERVRVGARLACAEMLLSGVTGFVDHYFYADQIALAAQELGIRADIAPTFFSSSGIEGRAAAFDTVDEILALDNPRIRASLGPHSTYTVTEEDLILTADHARDRGLKVHLHVAENMDQTRSSVERLGVTPIQVAERTGILDAGTVIAHGCGITPDDIAILARYADRTGVSSGPKGYLKFAFDPITPVRGLLDAGITVGAGTDGAASNGTLDVLEAMQFIAVATKQQEHDVMALTTSDALRIGTRGGATLSGMGSSLGALEVGRRADIVLVDLSGVHCRPLHDPRAALLYSARSTSDVHTVLVDGDLVVADRRLLTYDLAEILSEADAIAAELVDLSQGGTIQHYAP